MTARLDGPGIAESAWASSPALEALPWASWQDMLDGSERLVVVAPHPDDEILGAAGLIHAATTRGLPVRVVGVTRGEACYPGDTAWTPSLLATIRPQESLAALALLGVGARQVIQLRIPDGAVAAHEPLLCAHLRDVLGARDHVLTTWSKDGHPDHDATSRAVAQAAHAEGARLSGFPIWAWHWMDPHGPLPLPGARRYRLSDAQQSAKAQALAAFVSQRQHPTRPPILPPAVIAHFIRPFEVFCNEHN